MELKATFKKIGKGPKGTLQTLKYMREQVLGKQGVKSPLIFLTAREIVKNVPERDKYAEAEAIFQWIKENIRFTNDPFGIETLVSPEKMLQIRSSDCDCIAMLVSSLYKSIGFPTRFVAIKTTLKPQYYSHVYTQVYVDGEWITSDPSQTWAYFGWEYPFIKKKMILPVDKKEGVISGIIEDIDSIADLPEWYGTGLDILKKIKESTEAAYITAREAPRAKEVAEKYGKEVEPMAKAMAEIGKWAKNPFTWVILLGMGYFAFFRK